jgi:hypothetical protein
MNRRSLLALAAVLPAVATSDASACSPALSSPRRAGLQNQQIRKLFAAWWQRDKDQFQSVFKDTLMSDGSPMETKLATELKRQSPLPDSTFDIFDRFFSDKGKTSRLTMIVNTEAGVVVACSEQSLTADIQPDCSGMALLHLFLVVMSGLNARAITHFGTTSTPETGKFSIWVDG